MQTFYFTELYYALIGMRLNDVINFLSKITIRKFVNALLIISSYYLSKIFKKPIQWGLPITISIEPTTECNLGCPECPSGVKFFTRPTGYLNMTFYDKFLAETANHLVYLYFYFQGEPYLHPQFLEMVKKAAGKNIYTVTSTNGHFLTERKAEETVLAGLDRIIISLDGTTQQTYAKYRIGGSYEKVITGIRNLTTAKAKLNSRTPHIILQFIVMKHNEHEIEIVKKLAADLAVDELKMKTVQVYNLEENAQLIPENEQYRRYNSDGEDFSIKNKLLNHCWKLWHSCVVTWDGKVAPCCFDKDASHRMGDLTQTSFPELWHNENYRAFRNKIIKSRKEIDICTNCSEGTKVWVEE